MDIDMRSIGNRIRYYRLQKNWTLSDLGNAAGLSWQQMGHIERGERACSLEALIQIANAFVLPADELLVDNLVASTSKKVSDEYYMLLDCTPEEATILIRNMRSLKEILRTYTIK